jgi:hypothetical protein
LIYLMHDLRCWGASMGSIMSSTAGLLLNKTNFFARIDTFNQHDAQSMASKPSWFTWYAQCMIWDAWGGHSWAHLWQQADLQNAKNSAQLYYPTFYQYWHVQSIWHSNHCFKTISILLIHPMPNSGWLGRVSIGFMSDSRLVLVPNVDNSAQEPIPLLVLTSMNASHFLGLFATSLLECLKTK